MRRSHTRISPDEQCCTPAPRRQRHNSHHIVCSYNTCVASQRRRTLAKPVAALHSLHAPPCKRKKRKELSKRGKAETQSIKSKSGGALIASGTPFLFELDVLLRVCLLVGGTNGRNRNKIKQKNASRHQRREQTAADLAREQTTRRRPPGHATAHAPDPRVRAQTASHLAAAGESLAVRCSLTPSKGFFSSSVPQIGLVR